MKGSVLLIIVTVLFSFLQCLPSNVLAQDACEGNFDCDQDVDGTDAAVFKADFGRSAFNNPCPECTTGATCEGTLSPGGRWCDQGNGTVKDMTTGLVWLQDGSCMGLMNWYSAIEQPITNLKSGDCGLTDGSQWGDWRLPTVSELEGITIDNEFIRSYQTYFFTLYSEFGCNYWSATTLNSNNTSLTWFVGDMSGFMTEVDRNNEFRCVWPVRVPQY